MSNPRVDLATALGADPELIGWTAYAFPPEAPVAPAIVITPASPYRTDQTYADRESWGLELLLLVTRSGEPGAAYLELDRGASHVRRIVRALSGATWGGVQAVGPTEERGGVSYQSARCAVSISSKTEV